MLFLDFNFQRLAFSRLFVKGGMKSIKEKLDFNENLRFHPNKVKLIFLMTFS